MVRFGRILCPIDFTEPSRRALSYSAALARWYSARLEAVHVTSPPESDVADGVAVVEPDSRGFEETLAADLRRFVSDPGLPDVVHEVVITRRRTHEAIVERARATAADLLVMGTHGRGGFDRLMLGSVTERVLRTAPCPVLTVPAAETVPGPRDEDGRAPEVTFRRILCPLDFSAASLLALQHALSLARESNGAVTVLYALEYLDPEEPCEHVEFDIRRRRQHFLEQARARLHAAVAAEDTTWCDITEVVDIGRAYKVVLEYAASWHADLICMGAQGHGGLELTLYGSNTQHVSRAATCPVLTVHG